MSEAPPEVWSIAGQDGNDILFATQTTGGGSWSTVIANGGDDVVVRDRTGGYSINGNSYYDRTIFGGQILNNFTPGADNGFDIVGYQSSAYGLAANLGQGVAQSDTPNHWPVSLGADFLFGIEGLVGTAHDDSVIGSAVRNKLWGHDGDDVLWGEGGADDVWGGLGDDLIYGGTGVDKLYGDAGEDRLRGGDGDDDLRGDGGDDTLHGDAGNDALRGGDENDSLFGGAGEDTLYGDAGDDALHMGAGDDAAYGGSGNDRFHISGAGANDLYGGSGADWVQYAGAAPVLVNLWGDTAFRTDGTDTFDSVEHVQTGTGADTVFGTSGYNRIWTGSGNDAVYTMGGNDEVRAGSGHDVVVGYGGVETIYGEGGNDRLYGNGGDDAISGAAGQDLIQGGDGDDELWGGADADTFHFAAGDDGVDTVHDFNPAQDKLSFGAGYFEGQNLGGFDVSEALWAYAWGGVTSLYADRAGQGLTQIAVLEGANATTINQKISNGTIFDVETSDVGGGPGGLAPLAPIAVFEPGWDMLA